MSNSTPAGDPARWGREAAAGETREIWAGAVAAGLENDEESASLEAAVAAELGYLWTDLEGAIRYAHKGCWSMGCDWYTTRIVTLTRLTRPTPWQEVPTMLLMRGIYQGIMAAAGFEVEPPDLAEVARTIEASTR